MSVTPPASPMVTLEEVKQPEAEAPHTMLGCATLGLSLATVQELRDIWKLWLILWNVPHQESPHRLVSVKPATKCWR